MKLFEMVISIPKEFQRMGEFATRQKPWTTWVIAENEQQAKDLIQDRARSYKIIHSIIEIPMRPLIIDNLKTFRK